MKKNTTEEKTKELPELEKLRSIEEKEPELMDFRGDIDEIDREIVELLIKRVKIALEIGARKKEKGASPYNIKLQRARIDLAVARVKETTDDPKFHALTASLMQSITWYCGDCQYKKFFKKIRNIKAR